MKFKKLWISDYKNLKNIEINFQNSISVFIGKNWSWKSNLLEAIVLIFKSLYDSKNKWAWFGYKITYEIKWKTYNISYLKEKEFSLKIQEPLENSKELNSIKIELPKRVITYNSWTWINRNKWDMVIKWREYNPILSLTSSYYKIAVLSFYFSKLKRHKDFLKLLNIEKVDSFKITYNKNKKSIINNSSEFILLKKLSNEESENNSTLEFDWKFLSSDDKGVSAILWAEKEFFNILFYLKEKKVIENIEIDITLLSWEKVKITDLSEWQKQLTLTYWVSQFFDDEENLFLFDEPDTFSHPNWQKDFIPELIKSQSTWNLLTEDNSILTDEKGNWILFNTWINGHFLITTHSPLLVWSSENIDIFWLKDIDWKSKFICWTNENVKSKLEEFKKNDVFGNRAEFIYENVFWLESTRANSFEDEVSKLHKILKNKAEWKKIDKAEESEVVKLKEFLVSKIWDDINDLYLSYLSIDELSKIIKENYEKNK